MVISTEKLEPVVSTDRISTAGLSDMETSDNSYYFATNIQSDSNATGKKAFEITSDILKKLHIWN